MSRIRTTLAALRYPRGRLRSESPHTVDLYSDDPRHSLDANYAAAQAVSRDHPLEDLLTALDADQARATADLTAHTAPADVDELSAAFPDFDQANSQYFGWLSYRDGDTSDLTDLPGPTDRADADVVDTVDEDGLG